MNPDIRRVLRLLACTTAALTATSSFAAGNPWSDGPPEPGSEIRLRLKSEDEPDFRVQKAGQQPYASDVGAFRTVCEPSHLNFDDPIVFPGAPGKSHLHLYFGNTRVNHATSTDSLAREGQGSCRGGTANRSSYWIPAMLDSRSGRPVPADVMHVYYKKGYNNIRPEEIQPIPVGLRVISGNPVADGPTAGDTEGLYRYECFEQGGGRSGVQESIPACPPGAALWVSLLFPNCWDGVNLDSPDHRSHMAYSWIQGGRANRCPRSHPVALPSVTYQVVYPVGPGDDTRHWRLSSDSYAARKPGGFSMHGDLMSAWVPEVQLAWINGCVRATLDCYSHLLGDGRAIY